MKKSHIWIMIMAGIVFVVLIAIPLIAKLITYVDVDSAKSCVFQWARLDQFPDNVQDFKVKVTGNMFTRGFEVTFHAPPQVLEAWVKRCPGLNEAEVTVDGTRKIYAIKPGGGAQYAQVVIDGEQVFIRTYWS